MLLRIESLLVGIVIFLFLIFSPFCEKSFGAVNCPKFFYKNPNGVILAISYFCQEKLPENFKRILKNNGWKQFQSDYNRAHMIIVTSKEGKTFGFLFLIFVENEDGEIEILEEKDKSAEKIDIAEKAISILRRDIEYHIERLKKPEKINTFKY